MGIRFNLTWPYSHIENGVFTCLEEKKSKNV